MAPHDPLFKRLLQKFFVDFLRLVAPDVAVRLDLSAPVFLDKELLLPGDPGSRVVDLLVRIPLLVDRGRA
ncbi:MAG TPA: flagellar assembly protein H, partial [Thermoanaerobaculia bacterium]|nr:flagellar assembly protein H [Thermoanaerobaculia bacterium]